MLQGSRLTTLPIVGLGLPRDGNVSVKCFSQGQNNPLPSSRIESSGSQLELSCTAAAAVMLAFPKDGSICIEQSRH